MSTEDRAPGPAPGAVLLCRADPTSVAPTAQLLREPMVLTRAGPAWSALVPEGRPWRDGGEPLDRVVSGWAAALAVGAPWPVLALWWDADRAGYTLAAGFRRPVGYVWLADGTPAGEDEAMRTFAARLGLDPVHDMQALERLTAPEAATDARARLRGLLAVLARARLTLPPGLTLGEPAARLLTAARVRPDAEEIDWPGRRAALGTAHDTSTTRRLGRRLPWRATPKARALALAQVAAGLPVTAWGLRHRGGGWIVAGALLLTHGALGLVPDLLRPRD